MIMQFNHYPFCNFQFVYFRPCILACLLKQHNSHLPRNFQVVITRFPQLKFLNYPLTVPYLPLEEDMGQVEPTNNPKPGLTKQE